MGSGAASPRRRCPLPQLHAVRDLALLPNHAVRESVAASLYQTGKIISTEAAIAASVGYAVGTVIHSLIQSYDPELDDAIGGTVVNMLQQITEAGTDASKAQYISALKALFGISAVPVLNLPIDSPAHFTVTVTGSGVGTGRVGSAPLPGPIPGGFITVSPGFFLDGGNAGGSHK